MKTLNQSLVRANLYYLQSTHKELNLLKCVLLKKLSILVFSRQNSRMFKLFSVNVLISTSASSLQCKCLSSWRKQNVRYSYSYHENLCQGVSAQNILSKSIVYVLLRLWISFGTELKVFFIKNSLFGADVEAQTS